MEHFTVIHNILRIQLFHFNQVHIIDSTESQL